MKKLRDREVLGAFLYGTVELRKRGLVPAHLLPQLDALEDALAYRLAVELERTVHQSGRRRRRDPEPPATPKRVIRDQLLDGHEGP